MATVDAIVEATAQVLRTRGYRGATLARIAERAGVSVGSIYQYFPRKEALLAAVMERHVAEQAAQVQAALATAPSTDLATLARAVIRGVVDAHLTDAELHRVLVEELPRVGSHRPDAAFLSTLQQQVAAVVATAPSVRTVDPELAALVVVSAVDRAIHACLLERNTIDRDDLVDELVHLVLGYLEPRRPQPSDTGPE